MTTDATTTGADVRRRDDVSSGLFCIALAARHFGLRVSSSVLRRQFGHLARMAEPELIRAFVDVGLKARAVPLSRRRLRKLDMPVVLVLDDGRYALLTAVEGKEALVRMPGEADAQRRDVKALLAECRRHGLAVSVPEVDRSTQQRFGWRWFFSTFFRYRTVMREALAASLFIQLFALATPIFFMIIIDKVFTHHNLSTLEVIVLAMIVVALFDVALNGVRTYLLAHTGNRMDVELGVRLFRHMMSLPLAYFESRRTGDTIARIRELEAVRNFLTGATLTLLIDVLFTFVFIAVMFLFSPLLATIVLCTLPLYFLVSAVITPMMRSRMEDKHKKMAENQSFLVETLGGIESIKASAMEPGQQREWEHRLADYARCSFGTAKLNNLINQLTSFISKALTIVLLFLGAKMVLSGEFSVGQLIAFNMLASRAVMPIQRMAQVWQEFMGVRVSVRRLADILDAPSEPVLLREATELPDISGEVTFDCVSFRYDADKPVVLEEISFHARAGEKIGVVGATGSGKTTLAKLIQRLYVPSAGRVLIDGINIASVDGAWLRRQIGVVAQDFVLFNRTIRDNITLGDPEITDEEAIAAAKLVGAHDTIIRLPQGYDTRLSERGRGLSTGQRQSIALARAVVTRPAILILDEATSALDYETEQRVQANFERMCEGRTVFVIAHRFSTLRQVDRVLTLEHGRLVEDGTPARLLSGDGRLARMHALHGRTWTAAGDAA